MTDITWKTERRKISELIPFKENPRLMDEKQRKDLHESIEKFGLVEIPVINTDNMILAGHQRIDTMKQKYGDEEIDVRVPNRQLSVDEATEYLLRSNKNTGEWDDGKLSQFFDEKLLQEVGWESVEVDAIFKTNAADEDDFDVEAHAQQITEPVTKPGDLYTLGSHRLLCGDATKPEDMAKLMGPEKADMVFTDPPYNMNIEGKQGKIMNDNMTDESFIEFAVAFVGRMKEASKAGAPFYICSGYMSYIPFVYALKVNGMHFANPIVWVKNTLGLGMNDYRHSHEMLLKARNAKKKAEPILYGWNEGRHYFADVHDEADVWQISRKATNSMVHPTQKPIALVSKALTLSSKRDEIILDPFAGGGEHPHSVREGRPPGLPNRARSALLRHRGQAMGSAHRPESSARMILTENIRQWIRTNGRHFTPAFLPEHIPRGVMGKCFDNSIMIALLFTRFQYVEGMARDPVTGEWILHSWVTDGEHSYDATWQAIAETKRGTEVEMPVPTEYIGIVLNTRAVANFMRKTEYCGIIANGWRNRKLADKILPEGYWEGPEQQ